MRNLCSFIIPLSLSKVVLALLLTSGLSYTLAAQPAPIGLAWARNSVNGVVFRRNSVVTHHNTQYVAYYDSTGHVVLGKRKLGTEDWQTSRTRYSGNVKDAHNCISIMVDGDGYLHLSWDHHGNRLHYAKSIAPDTLALTEELGMVATKENKVTYPEFYKLPGGDLLFLYRDGGSGNGDLVMNRYNTKAQKWRRVQDVLIDGEGQRNAYSQACIDAKGTFHLSWVWRETGDVATNHDVCYAKSTDQGLTWQKTTGEKYTLPINATTAEYALKIPVKSELINTTSMYADARGNPYIATYFAPRGSNIPQYFLIYNKAGAWNSSQITQRTSPFSLSGGGTRKIPISRPHIVIDNRRKKAKGYLIYRDMERGDKVTVAATNDLSKNQWKFRDITDFSVGNWEPSYDTELWKQAHKLHLYVQNMGQGERESLEMVPPQPVYIYEVRTGR